MLSSMVGLPQPQGVHASVIVATTAANMLVTFAVDSSDRVRLVFEQDVCGDPPRHLAIVPATLPSNVDGPDCVRALSVASDGTLRYWALEMPLGAAPQWQLCASVKTAIVDSIMAVGGSTMKAAIGELGNSDCRGLTPLTCCLFSVRRGRVRQAHHLGLSVFVFLEWA